jgi:hypothetical protein
VWVAVGIAAYIAITLAAKGCGCDKSPARNAKR